jgi:hypothetical protein
MAHKTWAFATDIHGDQQHAPTVNALFRFVRDFRPDVRICGGDVFDFRALRGKATAEERRESMKQDFEQGMDFLEAYKPHVLLAGNHDKRLWEAAERTDGPMSDYARELASRIEKLTASLRCRLLPYDKVQGVYELDGGPRFVHGFQGTIRRHAEVFGPVVYGHVHCGEHCSIPRHGGKLEAWSMPCLCVPNMPYNSATIGTLRYSTGWGYGHGMQVYTAEAVGGRIVAAKDVREYAA